MCMFRYTVDSYTMCLLLCTWLRLRLDPFVQAYFDPQTVFVFYHILFVSTRIGPWTWTEPSADEKRRGLQKASPWRASVRRGQTSPFNLPRAAAGRYPSLFFLHNPTSKHWRQSRFLGISFFKECLCEKGREKIKFTSWSAGTQKLYHRFHGHGKHFATVSW